ncbi:MAG: ATP-binding protein [Rhodothermaceae bacterium]|nr:ATP-binding protein [Rhodothermaceae bacterium]MXW32450.1 ATP-binding protein [Rhodothermaceae bacterium]MYC05444.1 ATP-binding protein [Rhodothermaceae bacterium]MYE63628.1 ATP-binding protein [Rhodothermaceae bacterium]MYI16259.1 ATP-binding protein [Rhodothermaceae bacterium]
MAINEYERPEAADIVAWISSDPNMRITAITGPRQTGKTTMALQIRRRLMDSGIPCQYYAMDNPVQDETGVNDYLNVHNTPRHAGNPARLKGVPNEETLVTIWERARLASQQSERGLVLFLDEIQIVPRWSNIVKGLWDADRRAGYPLRIVILGSAPWRMLTGINESLMGRFDSFPITHWSLKEMTSVFDFSVEEYIFFGGYPGPWTGKSKNRSENIPMAEAQWRKYILNSIIQPAIDRDIIGLKRIHKPTLMRQLVGLAPNYSAEIISYNKMLGQLQDAGNTTTLAKYLDLLSDAGLMTTLSRYTQKPHSGSRASSPKLNVLNTALMTANSIYSFQGAQSNPSFWGHLVESAVGAHLYNTRTFGTKIHYWRDNKGIHEVDYVIARGPHLLGVEVKSGKVRSRRGLRAFKERFPNARTMVVGAEEIPLNEFFSLRTEQLLEEL